MWWQKIYPKVRVIQDVFSIFTTPNKTSEENDAENFLKENTVWPFTTSGTFYLGESIGDDENEFIWAIGELEMQNFKKPIMIEFGQEILISTGLNQNEEFPEKIKVEINPTVNESYEVISVELI